MHGVRLVNSEGAYPDPGASGAAYVQAVGPQPVLVVQNLVKQFKVGQGTITALQQVNLVLSEGEFLAIRGRSGAGKTTLLNLIAGLDDPTSGHVLLLGRDLSMLNERQRTELRRHELGFVFQSAHLFPSLTARENVEVPLRLARTEPAERSRRSHEALAMVGLPEREQHRAPELSGGQQQRGAIARALVHAPRLVLADEPNGDLDTHTSLSILELMLSVAHQPGIPFIITTHDPQPPPLPPPPYPTNTPSLTPA